MTRHLVACDKREREREKTGHERDRRQATRETDDTVVRQADGKGIGKAREV